MDLLAGFASLLSRASRHRASRHGNGGGLAGGGGLSLADSDGSVNERFG